MKRTISIRGVEYRVNTNALQGDPILASIFSLVKNYGNLDNMANAAKAFRLIIPDLPYDLVSDDLVKFESEEIDFVTEQLKVMWCDINLAIYQVNPSMWRAEVRSVKTYSKIKERIESKRLAESELKDDELLEELPPINHERVKYFEQNYYEEQIKKCTDPERLARLKSRLSDLISSFSSSTEDTEKESLVSENARLKAEMEQLKSVSTPTV